MVDVYVEIMFPLLIGCIIDRVHMELEYISS